MLGELLHESRGKRVVRRVLSSDPAKVEVTFEASGKVLGVDVNEFGTYVSEVRADASIYGKGEGLVMSAAGDLVAWKGTGLGKFGEGGAVSYRGIVYYRTTSQRLAKLNNAAGVFEYEVDPKGETHSKVWEWK